MGSETYCRYVPSFLHLPPFNDQAEKVNRHNLLRARARRRRLFLCASVVLLMWVAIDASGQLPDLRKGQLLYGSILTAQGEPAAAVTVEMRDLRGIKVASAVTNNAGNFQMTGKAEPGEYVLVALRTFQIQDRPIRLDRPGLEVNLALPADSGKSPRMPAGYTVSAKQLQIPARAKAHLVAAHREFTKMRFDRARQEVDSALGADPTFGHAFAMRAFIKLAQKDPQGAKEDAEHATLLDPDDTESFIALAMSDNSLKDFDKAADAAQRALSVNPASWQGRLELAKSYYGEGELIRALCEMDSADIDFPDAHLVRANVLVSLSRNQEAKDEFDAFLREAPQDPRVAEVRRAEAALMPSNHAARGVDR